MCEFRHRYTFLGKMEVQTSPLVWSTYVRSTRLYGQFWAGANHRTLILISNPDVRSGHLYGQLSLDKTLTLQAGSTVLGWKTVWICLLSCLKEKGCLQERSPLLSGREALLLRRDVCRPLWRGGGFLYCSMGHSQCQWHKYLLHLFMRRINVHFQTWDQLNFSSSVLHSVKVVTWIWFAAWHQIINIQYP